LSFLALGSQVAAAQTPAPTPLRKIGEMEVSLVSVAAAVEPLNPVVPKNTASGVRVVVRSGGERLSAEEVGRFVGEGFRVEGELSGPGLRETISLPEAGAASGADPLLLRFPALPAAGDYTLSNLRLVVNGSAVLDVTPQRLTVKVIDQILITSVTTRPLTLDEIRERGIVIDSGDYLGFEFTLGLSLDSRATTFTFPVVFDQRGVPVPQPSLPLASPTRAELPPMTSIVPLLLTPQRDSAPLPRVRMPNGTEAEVRIPSVLVIPGNVGYLKQFFSAKLFVANGAPGGSGLTVQNVTGKIKLPAGADQVADSADDPLTLPDTDRGAQPSKLPVRAAGPDGQPDTADDLGALDPGEQGQAEFLLRGEKEGFHQVEFDIEADLAGLPTGAVRVAGKASGGVLVRNPYFDMTFSVPATVRRGERFKVFVTVNNISQSLANDVKVTLDASRMSGARAVGDLVQGIDTLRARDSRTLEFEFESQRTGQVVANYLRFDTQTGTTGEMKFTLGVGERGLPLSPDTLVLPSAVDDLPADVVAAAMRVLGQAWSVANAPPATLPRGVTRTSRNVVTQKALALAEAGLRVNLGQKAEEAVRDLVFDFYGGSPLDPGFDQLLRETEAGRDLSRALGARLADAAAAAGGALDYERAVAQLAASGPDFISFAVAGVAGGAPPVVSLSDSQGRRSSTDAAPSLFNNGQVPGATLVPLGGAAAPSSALGVLTAPDAFPYTLELKGGGAGTADIAVTVPAGGGSLLRGSLRGFEVAAGGRYSVTLGGPGGELILRQDADADGAFESQRALATEVITPQGPRFVSATVVGPEMLAGASPFGFHLAVLFDRVVDAATAARKEHYAAPNNAVLTARRQLSGRLVFATLEQPEGGYVPTSVTVSGVADTRGKVGAGGTAPLQSRLKDAGAVVSGRVLNADGAPVRSAVLTYAQNPVLDCAPPLDDYAGLANVRTGADGRFELRYVRQDACGLPFKIMTRDVATGSLRDASGYVRAAGEHIVLDVALFGRGSVSGTVRDLSGRPVPGTSVVAVSGTDPQVGGTATTDADGRYLIEGITVGPVSVKAVKGASLGRGAGRIDRAGTSASVDLTLDGGAVRVSGTVRRIEGGVTTPVSDLQVVYHAGGVPVAVVRTALDGGYAFEGMPTGSYSIVAAVNTRDRGVASGVAAAGDNLRRDIVIEVGGYGVLRGTARMPDGGPAAGVVVAVDDRGVLSGAGGEFELAGVPVRPNVAQTVKAVSRDGLRGGQGTFFVNQPNQVVEGVDITLSGLGAAEFTVLDAAGRPVANQQVALLGDCDNECGCAAANTNAEGRVRFDGLPLGKVMARAVRVSGSSVDQADAAVSVTRDGAVVSGVLRFGGFGVVSGAVLDPEGRPVLGADVTLVSKVFDEDGCQVAPGVSHRAKTDQAGKFRFTNVNTGQVSVTATHAFFPVGVGQKGNLARNGDEVVFSLKLVNTISGELSGTVFLPDGVTPAGRGVEVTASGALPDVIVTTDEQGRYRFARIFPEGNYSVVARDPVTGGLAQQQIFLRANQDVTHDLRLKGRGTVRVRVVNGADQPVADAFVRLQESDFPNRVYEGVVSGSNQGVVTFENVFEGRLSAEASDAFARGGRASAVLAQPGGEVEIKVALTTTGKARGRFLGPDGVTPIPFGVVRLVANGRAIGQTTTQGTGEVGSFSFDYVPAGQFRLEAQNPLTARTGFAVGRIDAEGQTVTLDVRAQGLGAVRGLVTSNGAPQAGAHVEVVSGSHRANTVSDHAGRYVLGGVPEGRVSVTAALDNNFLTGAAEGVLGGEGAELTLDVALRDSGRVAGQVRQADGVTPAGQSLVTIQVGGAGGGAQSAVTDGEGRFVFERVPAGQASVNAELFGGIDRGRATFEVLGSRTNDVTLVLNGVGSLRGRALDSSGQPVAGDVTVTGAGAFPYAYTVRAAADGSFRVGQILAGTFTATLRAQSGDFVLYGTASGAIADRQETTLDVQVQPSGTLKGRVLRSDGSTPAYGADVVLQLDRNRGSVHIQAGGDGAFTARGVPLGAFTARLSDPVTTGVGVVQGLSLDANGQTLDAGTVVLDDTPVALVSVDPADGAQGVAPDGAIVVTFSDPLSSPGGIHVKDGDSNLPLGGSLSADLKTVTFKGALPSAREISVHVTTDVRDLFGRAPAQAAVTRFRTADVIPPSVVSVQPANQSTQVEAATTVSVVFNEPLGGATDLSALISVGGASGAVAGSTRLTSPTTAAWTPSAPLANDTRYTVVVNGATDESGNRQAAAFRSSFSTRDTVAPTLRLDAPAESGWSLTARPLVKLSAADALSGLDINTATLALDGQAVAAARVGDTIQFTPPANLSEGAHALKATVADRAGNVATLDASFKIDTVAPGAAKVTGVEPDAVARGVIRLGASADDQTSGVHHIDILSDGQKVLTVAAPSWQADFDVSQLGEGARLLTARATDAAGHTGAEGAAVRVVVDSAVALPVSPYDANGFLYDVERDGSSRRGHHSSFSGEGGAEAGSFLLDLVVGGATTRFTGAGGARSGSAELGGRQYVVRQQNLSGLNVTRKVYVPREGYFARHLEVITNPTAAPITADVRVVHNSGSWRNGVPRVMASSNGDTALDVSSAAAPDRWFTFDDASDTDPFVDDASLPAMGFAFDGAAARARAADVTFSGYTTPWSPGQEWDYGPARTTYEWRSVVIAPGQSVAFMHFTTQQTSRAAARASLERLVQLPPEALSGLTAEEGRSVQNFAVPEGGASPLAALPPVNGSVGGRVLAGDGATPVPGTSVTFRSQNTLYARAHTVVSGADGTFSLATALDRGENSVAIPAGAFTLNALHPLTNVEAPTAAGTFPDGQSTAARDVVFSNTGVLRGVARRAGGAPVTDGSVHISGGAPHVSLSIGLDADGAFSAAGVAPGVYSLTLNQSHPQGSPNSVTVSAAVAAGQVANVEITLPAAGGVAGVVRAAGGQLSNDTLVLLRNASHSFVRSTQTNAVGQFAFDDVPAGPYVVEAREPNSGVPTTANVSVTENQTASVALTLAGFGRVRVQVNRADGSAAGGALVYITESARDYQRFLGQADAAGLLLSGDDVTVGPFVVRAADVNDGSLYADAAGAVGAAGEVVSVTVALPGSGTVRGRVLYPDGRPAAGSYVELYGDAVPYRWAFTDAEGDYSLSPVVTGKPFSVRAYTPEFDASKEAPGNVIETDGGTLALDIRLPSRATLHVVVRQADGSPSAGMGIRLRDGLRASFFHAGYTGADGVLDIPNVFEGAFAVQAFDASTGATRGEAAGAVAPENDGQTLDVNVTTALLGSVEGVVYAADGRTRLPGLYVELYDAGAGQFMSSARTDGRGAYRFGDVAPNAVGFRVRAYSPNGDDRNAEAAGVISNPGETLTLDLSLPVSVVKGVVRFADGVTPSQYPSVYARQTDGRGLTKTFYGNYGDGDGNYMVVGVGAGDFELVAEDGSTPIYGTASGSLADAASVVTLDVTLPPTGVVTGTVLNEAGAPVPYAQVSLTTPGYAYQGYAWADEQGVYRFEAVTLGGFSLDATDYNTGASGSAVGALTREGEAASVNITASAAGTVRGTVYKADGVTPQPRARVTLENLEQGAFRQQSVTADDAGHFVATGVGAGKVRAVAFDPAARTTAGIGEGQLAAGDTAVVNVTLGDAFGLRYGRYNLDGADGFRYDVDCDGSLDDGGTIDGALNDAYDGSYYLTVGRTYLPCANAGRLEDGGREIALQGPLMNGLRSARKVFSPAEGGFARYLEALSNPTATPITVNVVVGGYLGSDGDTRVVAAPAETENRFVVTDQGGGCCDPAVAHVYSGARPRAATVAHFGEGDDEFAYRWRVTVQPGQTVILMHFTVQRDAADAAGIRAQAEALVNLNDPRALRGMSAEEKAQVINFNIP
jgi:hypothetical protein